MQLSVEVKDQSDTAVLACRGEIVQGRESDYLFALVTRPDQRDVILDVEAVTRVDDAGLLIILLCYEFLVSSDRRLFLRNPSLEMLEGLRRRQREVVTNLSGSMATTPLSAWKQPVQ
jgi:anti-anti-sigma regulatory factor